MELQLLKEEDVKTEDETSGISVIGHDVEVSTITTEHEEILKEIIAIMQKHGYQYIPGEDMQGDISKFFVKEDTLMEIIMTPNVDKEILEMLCQGAEQ